MGLPDEATVDGFDTQMQTNHLSHFLLTCGIYPLLEKAANERGEARVVNHSSNARLKPAAEITASYLQKDGGNLGGNFWSMAKWKRYQQSKLANLLFTYALHERNPNKKIKILCAHPGATLTGLQIKSASTGATSCLDSYILNSRMKVAYSEEDGTQGILICCGKPDVNSGDFYGPIVNPSRGEAFLLPSERNSKPETLLWEESMKSTGAKWTFWNYTDFK